VAKGRILIIEQDEWESTLLAKFLGEAGYEVHVAGEARAGFEKVRELQPDCILCDVSLPDIDGFWVARRVRTEPSPVATAPFLFLTDAEDIESRLQGLNVGADLYLTRPFRNDIYWAVGFDAEGAKTLMQDYLTTAELRARGMDSKRVHQEVTKKFGLAAYPNPSRAGIAYMIAPIMRGVDDTNVPEPKTMNMPHFMIYAPGVSNADIGGKPLSMYPFMLSMSPGRDDFIIMLVGATEKAGILTEFKDLLSDLCAYRDYLCTNARTRMELPTKTGTEGL